MTITIYINVFNTEIGDQPLVAANTFTGAICIIDSTLCISSIFVCCCILTIGLTGEIVVIRAIAKIVLNG